MGVWDGPRNSSARHGMANMWHTVVYACTPGAATAGVCAYAMFLRRPGDGKHLTDNDYTVRNAALAT